MSIEEKKAKLGKLDEKKANKISEKRDVELSAALLQDENFMYFDEDIKQISQEIAYTLNWIDVNFQQIENNFEHLKNIIINVLYNFNQFFYNLQHTDISFYKKEAFNLIITYILDKISESLTEEELEEIKNIILGKLELDIQEFKDKKLDNLKTKKITPLKSSITKTDKKIYSLFREGEIIKDSILSQAENLKEFLKNSDYDFLGRRREHTSKNDMRKRKNTKLKFLQESFSPYWYYIVPNYEHKRNEEEALDRFVIDPDSIGDDFLIALGLVGEDFKNQNEAEKLEMKNSFIPKLREIFKNSQELETNPQPKNYTSRILLVKSEYAKGKIILFQTISQRYNKDFPLYNKNILVFDDVYSFLRSQEHTLNSIDNKLEELKNILEKLEEAKRLSHNLENISDIKGILYDVVDKLENYSTFFEQKAKKDRLYVLLNKSSWSGGDVNILQKAIEDINNAIKEKESMKSQISYQKSLLTGQREKEIRNWSSYYGTKGQRGFKTFIEGSIENSYNDFFEKIRRAYRNFKEDSEVYFKEDIDLSPFNSYKGELQNYVMKLQESIKNRNIDESVDNMMKLEALFKIQRFNIFFHELQISLLEGDVDISNLIKSLRKDLVLKSQYFLDFGGSSDIKDKINKKIEYLEFVLQEIERLLENQDYKELKEFLSKLQDIDILNVDNSL